MIVKLAILALLIASPVPKSVRASAGSLEHTDRLTVASVVQPYRGLLPLTAGCNSKIYYDDESGEIEGIWCETWACGTEFDCSVTEDALSRSFCQCGEDVAPFNEGWLCKGRVTFNSTGGVASYICFKKHCGVACEKPPLGGTGYYYTCDC